MSLTPTPPADAPESPRAVVERNIAAAREANDPRREAAALTDLGIGLGTSDPAATEAAFQSATQAAERAGDPALRSDVDAHHGFFLAQTGRFADGLALIERAVTTARDAGDKFAEKLALEKLGTARQAAGDADGALDAYARGIALARELADDRQAGELYWMTAMVLADRGDTDRAAAAGELAVRFFRQVGHPEAERLASSLAHYRSGGGPFGPVTLVAGAGVPTVQATHAGLPAGPGVLKMAWSAVKAAARFVGGGLRTVPAETRRLRLATCEACEHHTGTRCRLCGCFTAVKSQLPHERCPVGKWPA